MPKNCNAKEEEKRDKDDTSLPLASLDMGFSTTTVWLLDCAKNKQVKIAEKGQES